MLHRLLANLMAQSTHPTGADRALNVVVGHQREMVEQSVDDYFSNQSQHQPPYHFTFQERQLGTGHALQLAMRNRVSQAETIVVFNGDLPFFNPGALTRLLKAHDSSGAVATLATTVLSNPAHYGRVVRRQGSKKFERVVEFKDATPDQKLISEINGGVYVFNAAWLSQALLQLSNTNAANEIYLPDLFHLPETNVHAECFEDGGVYQPNVLLGINSLSELSRAQKLLYQQTAYKLADEGCHFVDIDQVYIVPEANVQAPVHFGTGVHVDGRSHIQSHCVLGNSVEILNSTIASHTLIDSFSRIESAHVGSHCKLGPYARIRPGTNIHEHVKIGNFVEVKASEIRAHTSASHLSYIGDADVGENVNIGCGFVTCNFDGRVIDGSRKHRSKIGNGVFVGSDVHVVAPIEIADGTFIASGSSVTETVLEPDSLVVARARQVTKAGYAKKYRKS